MTNTFVFDFKVVHRFRLKIVYSSKTHGVVGSICSCDRWMFVPFWFQAINSNVFSSSVLLYLKSFQGNFRTHRNKTLFVQMTVIMLPAQILFNELHVRNVIGCAWNGCIDFCIISDLIFSLRRMAKAITQSITSGLCNQLLSYWTASTGKPRYDAIRARRLLNSIDIRLPKHETFLS